MTSDDEIPRESGSPELGPDASTIGAPSEGVPEPGDAPATWQVPSSRGVPSLGPRVTAIVTVVLLVVDSVLIFGMWQLIERSAPSNDLGRAGAQGQLMGAILFAVILGLGLRWGYLRANKRAGSVIGLPALAAMTAGLLLGTVGIVARTAPIIAQEIAATRTDLGPYLADAAPYAMATLAPDEAASVGDTLTRTGSEVRWVTREGTLVGRLTVMPLGSDSGTDGDTTATLLDNVMKGAGVTDAGDITVAGRTGKLIAVPDGSVVIAVVEPGSALVAVNALDEETARDIAERVLDQAVP